MSDVCDFEVIEHGKHRCKVTASPCVDGHIEYVSGEEFICALKKINHILEKGEVKP